MLILLPPSEKKVETSKPTPAINVYTGVLYQALGWATLSPAARKRAASAVVIISAKYGAVRPDQWIESYKAKFENKAMRHIRKQTLRTMADTLQRWPIVASGTEGYRTAEVTLGGVDTDGVSSSRMESKTVPGLFFIGEVLDVTGWLGGYNFQWAWASGHAAGMAV